ncbi:uncharacterized protein P884DRAFT_259424 [Thermothelomyces heterothallicus CBS 202.75]|uniref:uncharacterized protein n=1 Tax=Thermothelomyces heterothallicus CBS 202.75 TaxID=1149848 RepID=UPI0037427D0B
MAISPLVLLVFFPRHLLRRVDLPLEYDLLLRRRINSSSRCMSNRNKNIRRSGHRGASYRAAAQRSAAGQRQHLGQQPA